MLAAERSVSRKFSKTYRWPPTLISRVSSLHYWKLLLRCAKGGLVSIHELASLQRAAGLSDSTSHPTDITHRVGYLREARKQLKEAQQTHIQLCDEHLQELADAKVLD